MYYILAITTIWFHPAVNMAAFIHICQICKTIEKIIGSMRYTRHLYRNIVAHKLMKIQLGQGEGLNKQKNLLFFYLANHNIPIHTVLTRSKLWADYMEQFQLRGLKIQPGFNDKSQ
jgi:hypothetical protein